MSFLKPGTLCCTVLGRDPRNNGRVVRVLHHVGAVPSTGISDGYVIEVVNHVPFSTIFSHLGGNVVKIHDCHTSCVAERHNLRPLLRRGIDNAILEHLALRGLPATEVNCLMFAFPEGVPDPLPAEYRAEMEEALEQAGALTWQS